MSMHIAHFGFSFETLRAALHLSPRPVSLASPRPMTSVARAGWMERLAIWADRQPMHHRMGSYLRMG